MTRLFFLLILTGFCFSIFAQNDTVLLMKGKKKTILSYQVIDIVESDTLLRFTLENGKSRKIFQDEVFSILKSDGTEKILYHPDPMNGEILKIAQMKSYVNGMYDAREISISPIVTVGGVAAGLLGALTPSPEVELNSGATNIPVGILVPVAYSVVMGATDGSESNLLRAFPDKFNDDYYIMGCNETLRKKKFRNSIIGSIVGFTAGIIILSTSNF